MAALVGLVTTGCDSCSSQPPLIHSLRLSGSPLSDSYSTSASGTCSGSNLDLDLSGIEFNDPKFSGHTFSWRVEGDKAIVFDANLGDLYVGTLPDLVDNDEIDLPSGGVVMNSVNVAAPGTLTATGSASCTPGAAPSGEGGTTGNDGGSGEGSPTGADASDPYACKTFTITAAAPATGPLGQAITLTGTGLSCLRTLDFRTTIDGYTYMPSEIKIVSDTEIQTTIPTHGTAETTLKVGGNCKGEFVGLSNVVTLAPVHALLYTITGTTNCP